MPTVECTCGDVREFDAMSDHVRREHLGVELSYACGLCDFTATSEGIFLAHCIEKEHDPKSDRMVMVRISLNCVCVLIFLTFIFFSGAEC